MEFIILAVLAVVAYGVIRYRRPKNKAPGTGTRPGETQPKSQQK